MGMIRYIGILLILFLGGCASQLDYFGNQVDLRAEIIALDKMKEDSSEKDKYYLTFIEISGDSDKRLSDRRLSKKRKTLNTYLKLIMNYYGYTENRKIGQSNKGGIIRPKYYVTVQFY